MITINYMFDVVFTLSYGSCQSFAPDILNMKINGNIFITFKNNRVNWNYLSFPIANLLWNIHAWVGAAWTGSFILYGYPTLLQVSFLFYFPAVNFQWYKGNYHFIRPDLHAYMFISRNGKLYFSVVSTNDAGAYRCIVKLSSNNGAAIGTNQPPSRISLPIQLRIINAGIIYRHFRNHN